MHEDEYGSKEKETEVFGTRSQNVQRTSPCPSTHLDTHGQKESRLPQKNLAQYSRRGQWRAGSPGRKRDLLLRRGASGRGVVRLYAQHSAKKIGEVR